MNSFLQSQSWEKFQQSVGLQTFRVDEVLLIKKDLPLGKSYLYCPRIFLGKNDSGKDIGYRILDIGDFLNKVKNLAERENCIFLRIEPLNKIISNIQYPMFRADDVQPSQTVILDLAQSEEKLLKNMRQKTRYNVRLAGKKGVKTRLAGIGDFDKFWKLMEETTGRDGFRAHSKEYYEKMLSITPTPSQRKFDVKLYFAEYGGKVLAAGIFSFYSDTVAYLHGASTHEHKNAMAPYLLHWEIIKLAKKQGYKYYDFYGVSEKKWPGVTRFKRGFGGREVKYPGTYDVVFNRRWYGIYKIIRKIRRVV